MAKLRKIMIGFVFTLILVIGVNAESGNVKAASAKNFKGNLNATYKNSKQKSKITIKKINSKKVSIKIVLDNDWEQGTWKGNIISKDTVQFTLDGGEKIKLKWKDKTHFTAKKPKGGFNSESVQMARRLCYSLNNTKYTQVKKSNTVYYSSIYKGKSEEGTAVCNSKISIKGNKVIVKGNLAKGTKRNGGDIKGTATKLKKATRTFKLDKNIKFYGNGGESPKPSRIPKNDAISLINNSQGLESSPFLLTVKNGKVTRIDFYS